MDRSAHSLGGEAIATSSPAGTVELDDPAHSEVEERVSVATQWQLMWWRFRRHRLAVTSTAVVGLAYAVVLLAEFLAYASPTASEAQRSLLPPQTIRWFNEGRFAPHVYGLSGRRDPQTFRRVYTPDPDKKIPLRFFAPGFEYHLFGLIPASRHLLGVAGGRAEESLFLLGTDEQGRDVWSRLMYATRTSLTIGLAGVALSLVLGVLLGGISGYVGGVTDTVIQRVVEILRSIPTIPLWMGLAAALPQHWSVLQVYLAITVIISLVGWTELARVVRGRFLSLREEEFVTAAELAGCSRTRIIVSHLVPSFLSHIIAATTLAIPAMIISETSLSFLGLGLRPPAISWGVLLQQAQNIQSLAISPWLLIPAVPVIVVIIAFNFMGDGLRDAADPYHMGGLERAPQAPQPSDTPVQSPGAPLVGDAAMGGLERAPQALRHSETPRRSQGTPWSHDADMGGFERAARTDQSAAPVLSVRDLRTYFFAEDGVVKAVDGASFDVHAGRTLGIVGESGCGKSVTARSILRIVERPGRIVSGEIRLRRVGDGGEDDLARLDPQSHDMRRIRGGEIGLVFQEPMSSFSPVHSVGNQIVETMRLHLGLDRPTARARAIDLLRLVGIPRPERRIDEYAFQLSGGLRQRAMIATALCCGPRILIADEPTTALDVTTQAQILALLRELQARERMAIVLITHNLGVVAEMCDEVAIMYLGRVVERGPVDAIFHSPQHPYTRALLRSIPSVHARVRTKLPAITGSLPHPYRRPGGCLFHPRCGEAIRGVCERHEPELQSVATADRTVSCFLHHPVTKP